MTVDYLLGSTLKLVEGSCIREHIRVHANVIANFFGIVCDSEVNEVRDMLCKQSPYSHLKGLRNRNTSKNKNTFDKKEPYTKNT